MVKDKVVIAKVRISKSSNQKTITIPKSAEHIKEGDYVKIEKTK